MKNKKGYIFPIWDRFDNIELAEDDEGNAKSVVQLLRTGSWEHPKYGRIHITSQALDEMKRNFEADVRGVKLAVDAAHENQKEAYGWIEGVKRKGDRLLAEIEWTDLGKSAIKSKRYRYISAELAPKWKDDETGEVYRNVLMGAGLTNRPYIRRMVALDENQQFSEAILLSEDLPETEGFRGCMLLPSDSKSERVLKFSREEEDEDMARHFDNVSEEELEDMVSPEEANDALSYLVEEAENLSPEEVDAIIDNLSDEDLEELSEGLAELEEIALSGDEDDEEDYEELDYEEDEEDGYYEDEDEGVYDEEGVDGLTAAQIEGVINAKGQIEALAHEYQHEPELVAALSETAAMLDNTLEGASISVLLSESDDPTTILLAEQFLRQKEQIDSQTYAFQEAKVDELITVLLHDPETNESVITPNQAEIAREIILTAPPAIRRMFCEFLNAAEPINTFDEYGTSYFSDPEDLPPSHPESVASAIVQLSQEFEAKGLSRQAAMKKARERVLNF